MRVFCFCSDVQDKLRALKELVVLHVNGEPQRQLLMHVIRFVVTVEDHALKKVLYLYLEVRKMYYL